MTQQSKPPRTEILRLAGEAGVDPRTAEKWLAALRDDGTATHAPVRPLSAERLAEAQRRIREREAHA